MAVISTVHVLFLLWCSCSIRFSSARSVQPSKNKAEDDISVTHVLTPYDARCDVAGCEYDLQLYCLDNGVIVMGSCSLKKTLCQNGKRNSLQLADSWDSCFLATYTIILPDQSQTAASGRSESSQEEEMEKEAADIKNLPDKDAIDLLNLQLEHELLTDPEKDPSVKSHGDSGETPKVKVHGDNGDRA